MKELEPSQSEYPHLDTSLIAAFVGELQDDDNEPSEQLVQELRETLAALAAHAEHQSPPDDHNTLIHPEHLGYEFGITSPLEALSLADSSSVADSSVLSSTSISSADTSDASFSSPLGFLQAAFPHINTAALKKAVDEVRRSGHVTSDDENEAHMINMERVVGNLLSTEYIRELAERGLDRDELRNGTSEEEAPWVMVNRKARKPTVSVKPKKVKTRTFAIVDVRQQQNRRDPASARPAPDPWIQMNSLAQRLTDLLPDKPPTFFLPFFHSPKYPTPAHAARAALATMAGSTNGTEEAIPANAVADYAPSLFTMFELLSDQENFATFDAEQQSRVMADAHLALAASAGAADTALEVVGLLQELDADNAGTSEMGIYHSAAPAKTPKTPSHAPSRMDSTPVSLRSPVSSAPSSPVMKRKTVVDGWQQVPEKARPGVNPHAAFIPAYLYDNTASRRGSSDIRTKSDRTVPRAARLEQKAIERARQRVAELQDRRDRALREASRMWRRGDTKNFGGEVAFYFAEQAREFQEAARKEALTAATAMVEARRYVDHCLCRAFGPDGYHRMTGNRDIDLHGTTAHEAVVIVQEILRNEPCSPTEPVNIITGKGNHSVHGISVLGPAVRNALIADGWNVVQGNGTLIVKGKMIS
jgi:DNA-nicking Smr family endonuclease